MARRKAKQAKEPERSIDGPEVVQRAVEEQMQQRAKALRELPLPVAAEPAFVFRP